MTEVINLTEQGHAAEAVRLADRAEGWRDFDRWPMTSEERIGLATVDATLALVHATLANAEANSAQAVADGRLASTVTVGDEFAEGRLQVGGIR